MTTPLEDFSASLFEMLSPRQRQIATLIQEGKDRAQIADLIGISPKTVDAHRWAIKGRLRVASDGDIARIVTAALNPSTL